MYMSPRAAERINRYLQTGGTILNGPTAAAIDKSWKPGDIEKVSKP